MPKLYNEAVHLTCINSVLCWLRDGAGGPHRVTLIAFKEFMADYTLFIHFARIMETVLNARNLPTKCFTNSFLPSARPCSGIRSTIYFRVFTSCLLRRAPKNPLLHRSLFLLVCVKLNRSFFRSDNVQFLFLSPPRCIVLLFIR